MGAAVGVAEGVAVGAAVGAAGGVVVGAAVGAAVAFSCRRSFSCRRPRRSFSRRLRRPRRVATRVQPQLQVQAGHQVQAADALHIMRRRPGRAASKLRRRPRRGRTAASAVRARWPRRRFDRQFPQRRRQLPNRLAGVRLATHEAHMRIVRHSAVEKQRKKTARARNCVSQNCYGKVYICIYVYMCMVQCPGDTIFGAAPLLGFSGPARLGPNVRTYVCVCTSMRACMHACMYVVYRTLCVFPDTRSTRPGGRDCTSTTEATRSADCLDRS